jgi:hypothetical protein
MRSLTDDGDSFPRMSDMVLDRNPTYRALEDQTPQKVKKMLDGGNSTRPFASLFLARFETALSDAPYGQPRAQAGTCGCARLQAGAVTRARLCSSSYNTTVFKGADKCHLV